MKRIITTAILFFGLISGCLAWTHGGSSTPNPLLSQRNVLNMNFVSNWDYAFINMVQSSVDNTVGPFGTSFNSPTTPFNQLLDTNGWPNSASATGHTFAAGPLLPTAANFGGPYVLTWTGSGNVTFGGAVDGVTCTETNSNTTYTRNGNCNWTGKAGQVPYIVMTITGPTITQSAQIKIQTTGGTDGFITGVKLYRQADEADLLTGNIFRAAFKQLVVNANPGALRFMNWHGGNNSFGIRWENRTKPNNATFAKYGNWVASPPYGQTTGTNLYSLSSVTGTPASMQHGELVTARFGNACANSGSAAASAIQNQNVPTVTTSGAHPFQPGDTVVLHSVSNTAPTGMMTKLQYFPVTVAAVADSTHFTINADTTTWGAFPGNVAVDQYISLQVGSGNDRTAYPVVFQDGQYPACHYGQYIAAQDYKTMVFNKNVSALADGAGNNLYGVWLFNDLGAANALTTDVPVEICTALVNELNVMAAAQGKNPIHMWINNPHMGLLSIDPDYTLASNYPVQMVKTILNGGTVNGITYAGLTNKAGLVVEFSNETWNNGGAGFYQTAFLKYQGYLRWPASGVNNTTDMTALRSTAMARDIHANVSDPRVKITLAGQGFIGFATNGANRGRVYGNASAGQAGNYYTTDSTVVAQGWGTPISNADAFATASYFDPADTYYTTTSGTGTLTDDAARYWGTDNSGTLSMTGGTGGVPSSTLTITAVGAGTPVVNQPLVGTGITALTTYVTAVSGSSPNYTLTLNQNATVANGATITAPANSGGNYIGAANTSQALTNFVTKVTGTNSGADQSITYYVQTLRPAYASGMPAGKPAIEYEGGTDWCVQPNTTNNCLLRMSVPQAQFATAVINSSQWSTAQLGYFNSVAGISNAALPSVYTFIAGSQSATGNQRWSYAAPDDYALNGGVPTEGQALLNNPFWVGMGARNQALSP